MKMKVIAIVIGAVLIGAFVFTQLPILRAKAATNTAYSYRYGMMGPNFNYTAMYDHMKSLTAKDVQTMMGGRISEQGAQNMLNACKGALKNAGIQTER